MSTPSTTNVGVPDYTNSKGSSFGRYLITVLLTSLFLSFAVVMPAQPPAASLSKFVDKFTGNFQHSIPLITVPGPNGEQFPITIEYNSGGIGVEQAASDVGLGWSLPIGEISRQVNGRPDDIKAGHVITSNLTLLNGDLTTSVKEDLQVYGPVHFKDLPSIGDPNMQFNCTTCVSMDLYSSSHTLSGQNSSIEFPDYDEYNIVGPLVSGRLGMHLFDYTSIFYKPALGEENEFEHDFSPAENNNDVPYSITTKRPTLLYYGAEELNVNAPLGAREYHRFSMDGLPAPTDPNNPILPYSTGSFPYPTSTSGSEYGDDLIRTPTNSIAKTGYQVNYFTNLEIVAHYSGVASIPNFMDWRENGSYPSRNDPNAFPPEGIGAIQVMDASGFTYHFSLPVYVLPETRYQFDLVHDGNTGYSLIDPNPNYEKTIEQFQNTRKAASTWKLTAVTGPDFHDNGNDVVDSDDTGYWIGFEYAKWSSDFATRYPVFGFQMDLGSRNSVLSYKGPLSTAPNPYSRKGTCIYQGIEVYYLNRIHTASHSALFVHDIRYDEHSTEVIPKPRLKLTEIVLIKNSELLNSPIDHTIQPSYSPFSSHTQTSVAIDNVINTMQMTSTLRSNALSSVRFDQDYSLAKRSYTNIKSGYASSLFTNPRNWGSAVLYYNEPSSVTPVNLSQSGKLTLKGISSFGIGGVQTQPGTEFTYYDHLLIDGTTDPLDSDPKKKDHFGHFKYDHDPFSNGGYTTDRSSRYLHAWSLKTISDPLGGLLTVNYEPDEYVRVAHNSRSGSFPTRYYQLRDLTGSTSEKIAWFGDRDGVYELVENATNPNLKEVRLYDRLFQKINLTHITETGSLYTLLAQTESSESFWAFPSDGTEFIRATYAKQYGGGVRVGSLTISDLQGSNSYELQFTYEGGICSAEPDPFDDDVAELDANGNAQIHARRYITMDRAAGNRHAPPSMVGYTVVTEMVKDESHVNAGGTAYEFANFVDPNFVRPYRLLTPGGYAVHEVVECNVYDGLFGKPLRITALDKESTAIGHTIYRYENEPSSVIEEAFYRKGASSGTVFNHTIGWYNALRTTYSAFVKRLNFRKLRSIEKHENSSILITSFSDHDHLTGEPRTTTISQDGVGTRTVTSTPAYGEILAMGPKWLDPNNRNILTPLIKSTNSDGTGSRSEWSATHAIRSYDPLIGKYATEQLVTQWAPTRSFTKIGEGTSDWKYLGRQTLFDPSMRPLEQKDMGDRYSATRTSLSGEFAIAEAVNCDHGSFTYCSFDGVTTLPAPAGPSIWFDGEVTAGDRTGISHQPNNGTLQAHSNTGMVQVESGSQGPYFRSKPSSRVDGTETIQTGLLIGRTYRALVWVHSSSPAEAALHVQLQGSTSMSVSIARDDPGALQVGDWVRLEALIKVPSDFTATASQTGLTVSLQNSNGASPAYFDDLLIHPLDAGTSTACWDESKGLMVASMGPDGFLTKYVHDAAGQVIEVYQESELGTRLVERTNVGYKKSF